MKLNRIFHIFIIAFLLVSCEKTIDFKSSEIKPKIVVNGVLEPGTEFRVDVKRSLSVTDKTLYYESMQDADVRLYIDGEFAENLIYKSDPDTITENLNYGVVKDHIYENGYFYSENIVPESGKTYRLEIVNEGFNDVVCETRVPFPVELSDLDCKAENSETDYGFKTMAIRSRLKFHDPDEENFYRLTITTLLGFEQKLSINSYYYGYGYYYDLSEGYPDDFEPSDTIIRYLSSPSYYDSKDPVLRSEDRSDILGTEAEYSSFFKDELINGKEYTLSFSFYLPRKLFFDLGEFCNSTITIENISRELYLYHISKSRQYMVSDNPFAEPVPVFNNIEGGLGIFGSQVKSSISNLTGEYPLDGKTYIDFEDAYNYGYGY